MPILFFSTIPAFQYLEYVGVQPVLRGEKSIMTDAPLFVI